MPTFDMKRSSRLWRVPLLGAALLFLLGISACSGPFPQSTLDPTSEFGKEIDALFRTIFWWAVLVFVVVESLLMYVVIKYRARPGQPEPVVSHGNTLLEIGWTLAPAVILIFIAVPTVRTIFATAGTPPPDALEVEVVGHQWWWEFRYPEYDVVTATDLHVSQGRTVSLKMTSADVIHSFWAPRLGGKRDVFGGRTTKIVFTPESVGVYLGQCAEFCGESHANMLLRVHVDESAEFEQWVEQQRSAPTPVDSLSERERRGLEAFRTRRDPANHSCIACHTIQGVSFGVLGPNLTHLASRSVIAGGILPNTREGITRWLLDPPAAKPGSLMPKIELAEEEISALVSYLQSLR